MIPRETPACAAVPATPGGPEDTSGLSGRWRPGPPRGSPPASLVCPAPPGGLQDPRCFLLSVRRCRASRCSPAGGPGDSWGSAVRKTHRRTSRSHACAVALDKYQLLFPAGRVAAESNTDSAFRLLKWRPRFSGRNFNPTRPFLVFVFCF